MPRVIRTALALDDLINIHAYIAQDNEAAADALIDRIDDSLFVLVRRPKLGRRRDRLVPGVRSWTIGRRYVLFYRIIEDGIELLRVLHGARNLRRALREGK